MIIAFKFKRPRLLEAPLSHSLSLFLPLYDTTWQLSNVGGRSLVEVLLFEARFA